MCAICRGAVGICLLAMSLASGGLQTRATVPGDETGPSSHQPPPLPAFVDHHYLSHLQAAQRAREAQHSEQRATVGPSKSVHLGAALATGDQSAEKVRRLTDNVRRRAEELSQRFVGPVPEAPSGGVAEMQPEASAGGLSALPVAASAATAQAASAASTSPNTVVDDRAARAGTADAGDARKSAQAETDATDRAREVQPTPSAASPSAPDEQARTAEGQKVDQTATKSIAVVRTPKLAADGVSPPASHAARKRRNSPRTIQGDTTAQQAAAPPATKWWAPWGLLSSGQSVGAATVPSDSNGPDVWRTRTLPAEIQPFGWSR